MTTTYGDGRPARSPGKRLRGLASAHSAVVFGFFVLLALLTTGALSPGGFAAGGNGTVDGAVQTPVERPVSDEAVDSRDGGGDPGERRHGGNGSNRTYRQPTDATADDGDETAAEPAAGNPPAGLVDPAADDVTDADGDGITDRAELDVYGTDPAEADTDGDGYPDGMEVACGDRLPGADPLHHDVFVEVDAVRGTRLDAGAAERLRTAFADAPVDNPDGESGIEIHLRRSDTALPLNGSVDSGARPGDHNDIGDYRRTHFDRADSGYYYVVVASEVTFRGDDYYAGVGVNGAAAIESFDSPRITSSLLMHELGHAFGIGPGETGVDEETYDRDEYHSVMNYNGIYEVTTYSDGTDAVGRDEWEFVADDRYRPPTDCGGNGSCAVACAAAE